MISPTRRRSATSIQNLPQCLAQVPTKQNVNTFDAIPPSQIHPEQEYEMEESTKGGPTISHAGAWKQADSAPEIRKSNPQLSLRIEPVGYDTFPLDSP